MDTTPTNSNFIDFDFIRNSLKFEGNNLFNLYLKDVYEDLSERDSPKDKGILGITKITFNDYMKLPIFISEKLFSSFDKDADTYINEKEFTNGFIKLYLGNFNETAQIIFNIMDFDKDGVITKGDAKVLLSYLPFKSASSKEMQVEYKHQMKSLEELDDILSTTFKQGKEKEKLTFEEFFGIISYNISDIYIQLLCFLYQNKPFQIEKINSYKNHKTRGVLSKRSSISVVTQFNSKDSKSVKSDSSSNPNSAKSYGIIPSPRKNSNFISTSNYIESVNIQMMKDRDKSPEVRGKSMRDTKSMSPQKSVLPVTKIIPKITSTFNRRLSDVSSVMVKEAIRMTNQKIIDTGNTKGEDMPLIKLLDTGKNVYNSPSVYFKNSSSNLNTDFSLEDNLKEMCIAGPAEEETVNYEDWIYRVIDGKTVSKYYTVLFGKEIIMYTCSQKNDKVYFHNLSGCFLKETSETILKDKVKYYQFSIVFSRNVTRQYLCTSEECKSNWIDQIKKAIGYANFLDFYELQSDIDEGRFGKVKLGIHKSTGEKVAIKIIRKDKLSESELDMQKNEMDLMKLFRHPNIVRLLDHFENDTFIYIVMEYLCGGNIQDYMHKMDNKLTEKQVGKIIYSVAKGIKYMNSFGVVHRDIKPDNIMLSNTSENAEIKIIDFGLTKTLAPNEKLSGGMGTMTYVAPEVISRKPYNKEIDIWSLGVILYQLLSGILPFDDLLNDNEEAVAKKVVFLDPEFPDEQFKNRSKEAIKLIDACLEKKPEKRITIDEFLKNDWLKANYK